MITNCCICGKETKQKCEVFFGEFMQITDIGLLNIGLCPDCGYIYAMNPISQTTANDYYKGPRHEATGNQRAINHEKKSRQQIRFIMDTIGPIQTVLEIGAYAGGNLSLYKELGLEVCGTDLSLKNVEYAKKQYDVELYHMDIDEFYAANKEKYDLVILSNVLEHIIDPCSVMKKVNSMNSKYVFIEVPSFDYKYIDMPYGMFIPTHQSYFTLESLKSLMRASGYKLLDANLLLAGGRRPSTYNTPLMQTVWERRQKNESGWDSTLLQATISSEQHLDFYIEQSQKLIKEIAVLIDRIPNDLRLAVWPISRSTALLFHVTNLGEKNIIKFYDNSKVFHNRKIAGRDVSPFNKDDVAANNIEAILISSYEHQSSIYNSIINAGAGCDIITLYK